MRPEPVRRSFSEAEASTAMRIADSCAASEHSERATGAEGGHGAPPSDGVGGFRGAKPPGLS
jgi:hypothetical protein